MLRAEKETVLAQLQEQLSGAQSVALSDYRGLRAGNLGQLRHEFRAAGVEFHVVKNSLLLRALIGNGLDAGELGETLTGPTAVAYTVGEEVTLPMKLVHEAAEKHEQLQLKGGLLEGAFVSAEEAERLAKLPGRTEMMAMIVGSLQSPVTGILSLLQTMIGNIVSGVQQIAEQKETAGDP